MLTSTYICKSGKSEKLQTQTAQFKCSFYTHGHFTHCDVIKNNNLCNLRLHSLFVDSLTGHLLSALFNADKILSGIWWWKMCRHVVHRLTDIQKSLFWITKRLLSRWDNWVIHWPMPRKYIGVTAGKPPRNGGEESLVAYVWWVRRHTGR